jgi:catalase
MDADTPLGTRLAEKAVVRKSSEATARSDPVPGFEKSDPIANSATGADASHGRAARLASALDAAGTSIDALNATRASTLALAGTLQARPFRPSDRATGVAPPAEVVPRERVSGAHGYFECDVALGDVTEAAPFAAKGKRTPVFARFSTMASERGSIDAVRDVRGFAVQFRTEDGHWDLVGRNIPVALVRDPVTVTRLIRAAELESRDPAAQPPSALETFWDVASRSPESMHMLMWAMSDRTLPRSYRTMQGFGVHTFRLVDAAGKIRYCKFHWTPSAGTHSLTWEEAVRVAACDHYFLHRDLWESIADGNRPEWTLGLQVFTQEQAEAFSFDALDPTKLVPEELVPVIPVGRMVLDRNPNNLLAETERVLFRPARVVPGIALADDPLLNGRIHSRPAADVRRHDTLAFLERCLDVAMVTDDTPGKAAPAAQPFTQAALFYDSQSDVEKKHIVAAFVFELTRLGKPESRERIVALLIDVDESLASRVAEGLGMPPPQERRRASAFRSAPEVAISDRLSLLACPGDGSIAGLRIAIVVADGADAKSTRAVHAALTGAGARTRFVGAKPGTVTAADGSSIEIGATFESVPSPLWDAVVVDASTQSLARSPIAIGFLEEQYAHLKAMWFLGDAPTLLAATGIVTDSRAAIDAGIVLTDTQACDLGHETDLFTQAVAKHKHYGREGATSRTLESSPQEK